MRLSERSAGTGPIGAGDTAAWWKHAASISVFVLLTVAVTWPVAVRPATTAVQWASQDSFINTWIVCWGCRRVCGETGDFWNGNIFHPHRRALAYNDHLFGEALLAWPVWAIWKEPLAVHNAAVLGGFLLGAVGAYLLSLELTRSVTASLLAGVVFALAPVRCSQLGLLNQFSSHWTPFALLFLHRFFGRGARTRDAALFALFLALQFAASSYNGMLATAPVGMLAVAGVVRAKTMRVRRAVLLLLAFALVALAVLPAYGQYRAVQAEVGGGRGILFSDSQKADLLDYFRVSRQGVFGGFSASGPAFSHRDLFPGVVSIALIAGMLLAGVRRVLRTSSAGGVSPAGERRAGVAGVGWVLAVVVVALTVVSVLGRDWAARVFRDVDPDEVERCVTVTWRTMIWVVAGWWLLAIRGGWRRVRRFFGELPSAFTLYLGMAAACVLLSMGRFIGVAHRPLAWGPYAALFHLVPGFQLVRSPGRFAATAMLCVGVCAACSLAALLAGRRGLRWRLVGLAAVVAAGLEFWPVVRVTDTIPSRASAPEVSAWLARQEEGTPVLELPVGHFSQQPLGGRYAFYSTFHWQPIVNGFGRCWPPGYLEMEDALAAFPEERSLRRLREVDARYVIIHLASFDPAEAARIEAVVREGSALRIVKRFGQDLVCEVAAMDRESHVSKR